MKKWSWDGMTLYTIRQPPKHSSQARLGVMHRARLSVIARRTKIFLVTQGYTLWMGGCLLSPSESVGGRQPHSCSSDMARATLRDVVI